MNGHLRGFGDSWSGCASASCVLMGAARSGIHAHLAPVDPTCGIGFGLNGAQDRFPGAVSRPLSVPPCTVFHFPNRAGPIPPRYAGSLTEEKAVDHSEVVLSTASSS
jgi:hypothetical protein